MKTILIPTDFSENSQNAVHYALEMNKKFRAKIILFHSYIIPIYVTDVPITIPDNELLKKEALKELKKLKEKFQALYPDFGFEMELGTAVGYAEDEIKSVCKNKKPDLVVMGTKGASGLREVMIGTVTASVIEDVGRTVIAVPEKAKFREIKKIVFATNYAENDYENIDTVIDFAKHFNAEVILFHISTGELDKTFEFNSIEHFKERMKEESKYDKITFKLLEDKDVLEGLNFYLDEIKADLIAMTTRHRSFFQKLFNRSMTKKMSYHTHIPLMAFHEQT